MINGWAGAAPGRDEVEVGPLGERLTSHLAAVTGMRQWTLNRKADEDYVVLAASPAEGGLVAGDRLPWSGTICALMVEAAGPTVAGTLRGTPYAAAESPDVRAYVGVPLEGPDGALLGTLSGTDDRERDDLEQHVALVRLLGALAAEAIALRLARDDGERERDLALRAAETDAMTGLPNRRAWDRLLEAEQLRLDRLGSQAGVLVVDLDGLKAVNDAEGHAAGDALIRRAGTALQGAVRAGDRVARVGGDELVVLVGDVTTAELALTVQRVRRALRAGGVRASVGAAVTGADDLRVCWEAADARTYEDKRARGGDAAERSITR